mgnify:CR=1 FL=1
MRPRIAWVGLYQPVVAAVFVLGRTDVPEPGRCTRWLRQPHPVSASLQRVRGHRLAAILHLGNTQGVWPLQTSHTMLGHVRHPWRVLCVVCVWVCGVQIDTLSAEIGNGCSAKYSLSAVPGTNTYLVAVAEASCVFTSSSCTCNQATYGLCAPPLCPTTSL